jgi:hypothetical protein
MLLQKQPKLLQHFSKRIEHLTPGHSNHCIRVKLDEDYPLRINLKSESNATVKKGY